MKYTIILTLSLFFISAILFAQSSENKTVSESPNATRTPDTHAFSIDTNGYGNRLIKDSQIIAMLDSLVHIKYFSDHPFTTDTQLLNTNNFPSDHIPQYHDSIVEKRIQYLNKQTPIELVFNRQVNNFINLYAVKKRDLTSRMLGLAELYFPMFEEQLDKYDLPLELKYLAVVESALNPTAGSRAGAKGIWQFMYGTGKVYGLKVTSYIDERYDPLKATIAACEHLQDLYNIYGDWSLVMAAYNSGGGNVNKAIRRAGGVKSYWAIWPFLPRETRGYVPAFISVMYVMNYSSDYNLYPVDPGILYNGIDSVRIHDILSFDQIHEMLEVPMVDIKFLNPSFKRGVIPYEDDKEFILWLPKEYIGDFINNEKEIYNYKTRKGIEKEKLQAEIKKAKERTIHVVRSGENLGLIAKKYHVYVSQLKAWNNLRRSTIYPGQKLILYPSAPYSRSVKPPKDNEPKGEVEYVIHTVRKGDTLWDIAQEYDGVTVTQIKRLNNIPNAKRLKPGQKIKVAVKTS